MLDPASRSHLKHDLRRTVLVNAVVTPSLDAGAGITYESGYGPTESESVAGKCQVSTVEDGDTGDGEGSW